MGTKFSETYPQPQQVIDFLNQNIDRIVDNIAQGVLDLSGAAQTQYLLALPYDAVIRWIILIYQEASSADAGVKVEFGYQALSGYATGRTTDRNYFAEPTSETSKAQWYAKKLAQTDLLRYDLQQGEILTVYNTGGKTGTGALYVLVGYAKE